MGPAQVHLISYIAAQLSPPASPNWKNIYSNEEAAEELAIMVRGMHSTSSIHYLWEDSCSRGNLSFLNVPINYDLRME
jgi:hypothetical protein